MVMFDVKKSMLAMGIVTATLAGGFSEEASAGCRMGHTSYRSRVVYVESVPVARPVTTIITKTEVVSKVMIAKSPVRPLLAVPQGSAMRIKVNFLGNTPGVVVMTAGRLTLQCKIVEWAPTHVAFQLPDIGVLEASEVTLDVAKADGMIARSVDILLTPVPDVEIIKNIEVIARAPQNVSDRQRTVNTGGLAVVSGK